MEFVDYELLIPEQPRLQGNNLRDINISRLSRQNYM